MYNDAPNGCGPTLGLAALLSLLSVSSAEAAIIASFDFEDAVGNFSNLAERVAPHVTATSWSDADGTLGSATGNPGFALTARSFDNGNEYRLTLTPSAGFQLALTGIAFDHRVSSTGPTAWDFRLNGNSIALGTTSTSFKSESIAFASGADDSPLLLTIFGSGASHGAGTFRLDNVLVSGNLTAVSAVPLPAPLWLFAPALISLAKARRRHCALNDEPGSALTT